MKCFEQKDWSVADWKLAKDYYGGNYIYDRNYDDALKYFESKGNKKPTDIELIEFFHKAYPEAHPMHLAADLHGIQQLMFGYKDFEGNPFEDNR